MSKARKVKSGQYVIGETPYEWTLTEQDKIYSFVLLYIDGKKKKEVNETSFYFKPTTRQVKTGVKLLCAIHNEAVVQKIDPEEKKS